MPVVICKRFSMDDIPVRLVLDRDGVDTMAMAREIANDLIEEMEERGSFNATEEEQRLAGGDLGTECGCLWLVEFDAAGKAVRSETV